MSLRLVRSDNEAFLFMELNPCLCGDPAIATSGEVVERLGQLAVEYRGACRRCGRVREFVFRLPEDGEPAPENAWSAGQQPSELLDAGEWRWVADRLASWPTDLSELSPEQRQRALEDTAAAASAIDEVLKFLPPGVEEVPESAFWSPRGRQVRAEEPGQFQRFRLEAARDGYRGLAVAPPGASEPAAPGAAVPGAAGSEAAGSEAAGSEEVASEEVALPVDGPLPARTLDEAHLYMDLRPCVCGSPEFTRDDFAALAAPPGHRILRYTGACVGCGRVRQFTFQLPDRPDEPAGPDLCYGFAADGPSQLLDPAEWLASSRAYTEVAEEAEQAGADWSDPEVWQQMVDVLTAAAAAVDEALRFLPGDASRLAPDRIRSVIGREIYRSAPEAFQRTALQARRAQRRERLAEFVARHPEPPYRDG
jgi:Fe-S cluster biogenesis protein NfuA